ncbi:purine/pyrimidine permease [Hazenella coriacea]|nr:purine/pyrimidine permease [Hazenella coriacea]
MSSVQWFIFLLANALTLPIVIGQTFHLSGDEIAGLMQRTLFVVGLASLLQGWLGHRLPISNGPAGIWLGIFIMMGEVGKQQGKDLHSVLQLLEGGMLLTGLILLVVSVFGLINRMSTIFTPLVTGSYLMLLSLQLSGVFLKGTIGINDQGELSSGIFAIMALFVFLLVLALTIWGKGWLKSYAVLIGIILGWIGFWLLGWESGASNVDFQPQLPQVFAWGMPQISADMVVTSVLVTMVLISNQIGSIVAMNQALEGSKSENTGSLRRTGIVDSFANILSSIFSTVGMVPISLAAGFVRMTGQKRMLPFLMGTLLLTGISLIPAITSFFAQMPAPIANAVFLASFGQMFGIGLNSVLREPLTQRRLTILGLTLTLGVGMMFVPPSVFIPFPAVLQSVLGNGLLVGMLIALLFEQLWKEKESEHKAL